MSKITKENVLSMLNLTDEHIEKINQFIERFQLDDEGLIEYIADYRTSNDLYETFINELYQQLECKYEHYIINEGYYYDYKLELICNSNPGHIDYVIFINHNRIYTWNELINYIKN